MDEIMITTVKGWIDNAFYDVEDKDHAELYRVLFEHLTKYHKSQSSNAPSDPPEGSD